jgi:hypothetical protein
MEMWNWRWIVLASHRMQPLQKLIKTLRRLIKGTVACKNSNKGSHSQPIVCFGPILTEYALYTYLAASPYGQREVFFR